MPQTLIHKILSGDHLSISRAISFVENQNPDAAEILEALYHKTGNAFRIGLTGPPGAGKSTLAYKLTEHYLKHNKSVGIIAVDPTSPFTGGALLGDRVRMTKISMNENVFIRSMATRGSLGGLAKASKEAADILDASGKDIIIFETVGVGQSELDIAGTADTTVVVLVPESGDSVQAMKAGLMEIANVFVLNKADRDGADRTASEIENVLKFRHDEFGWMAKLKKTSANQNVGIEELADAIEEHYRFMIEDNLLQKQREKRLIQQVKENVNLMREQTFWSDEKLKRIEKAIPKLLEAKISPHQLAKKLIEGEN